MLHLIVTSLRTYGFTVVQCQRPLQALQGVDMVHMVWVYGFTLVSIPHTVHMVSIVCPPPYPSMGSPVCGLTGLHWYNASSLHEGQTWFTWSGFTGLRGYIPLHSSRCSHGLRRLPPLPIHGFTIHMVCTSNMVDMVCMVCTGNMTPHSCYTS